MKIVIKDNFSYLYLNKDLYLYSTIEECIQDFKEFLEISIKKFEKYTILKLESIDKEYEIEELSFEFLNYLNGVQYKNGF